MVRFFHHHWGSNKDPCEHHVLADCVIALGMSESLAFIWESSWQSKPKRILLHGHPLLHIIYLKSGSLTLRKCWSPDLRKSRGHELGSTEHGARETCWSWKKMKIASKTIMTWFQKPKLVHKPKRAGIWNLISRVLVIKVAPTFEDVHLLHMLYIYIYIFTHMYIYIYHLFPSNYTSQLVPIHGSIPKKSHHRQGTAWPSHSSHVRMHPS